MLFVCHLGRTNHCDFFRTLEVGGREANKYSHVYDNLSVHGQLLSFFYLIMIDVQVVRIVDAIPRSCSCHIFMQIEKYGDVVDSFNNMMANNLIAEYSESLVQ